MKKLLVCLFSLFLVPLSLFAEESERSIADRVGTFVAVAFFVGIFLYLAINFLLHKNRKCPHCFKRKARLTESREIKAATYLEGGQVENTYRCERCGYTFTVIEDTPQLHATSSDSDSGSSYSGGGGGGSWGGGSTSGGGAGGKW